MKTEIIAITDRSGSMGSIASKVISGYNEFLNDQKKQPGEAKLTYTQFNEGYEVVYAGIEIAAAPELTRQTFVPMGNTALLDAIGKTLNDQGKRIADEKWADLVIVYIITDGEENASNEFNREQVQKMIKHAEANGWKFIFLAANQDAFAAAASMGISAKYTGAFAATGAGTTAAYSSSNNTVSSLRAGNAPDKLLDATPPMAPAAPVAGLTP